MLIKCNCLIAKCWEPILRGFQWNYLISSQEVHCRKKRAEGGKNGRKEKAKKLSRNRLGVFFLLFEYVPHEILTVFYSEQPMWGEKHVSCIFKRGHSFSLYLQTKVVCSCLQDHFYGPDLLPKNTRVAYVTVPVYENIAILCVPPYTKHSVASVCMSPFIIFKKFLH